MKQERSKKRGYRKYDSGFKMEAINQIKNGRSVKDLSASLGVGEALLYRWKAEMGRRSGSQSEEVKRLKKEVSKLSQDNEILKKALSIFSQSG